MASAKSPEESQATARLRVLSQGIRVYCLESRYRYCVPSASGGLLAYQILILGEEITCNCPAGQNDRICKHVAGVQMQVISSANGHRDPCNLCLPPLARLEFGLALIVVLGDVIVNPMHCGRQ